MGSGKPGKVVGDSEKIEILDIRGTAASNFSWFQNFIQDLSRQPIVKQVAIGGTSGWFVGYLSMKVGKVAATVAGGSLLLMQLAAYKGYIKIDWSRVNKDIEKGAKKIQKELDHSATKTYLENVQNFVKDNVVLATSFSGGVLLGIASS